MLCLKCKHVVGFLGMPFKSESFPSECLSPDHRPWSLNPCLLQSHPADPVSSRPGGSQLRECCPLSAPLLPSAFSGPEPVVTRRISRLHSQQEPFLTLKGERLQPWTPCLAKEILPALPTGPQKGQEEAACLHLHSGCIFVKAHYSQRKRTALALSSELEKLTFHQTNTLIPD